jgi:hypothetical protein
METHFRKKMVFINGYGFISKGYEFPLHGNGFPLQGYFGQNLKSFLQPKFGIFRKKICDVFQTTYPFIALSQRFGPSKTREVEKTTRHLKASHPI